MLHVFIGKDPVKLRATVHVHIASLGDEVEVERVSADTYAYGMLGEWAGAADLFGGTKTILLDMLSEHEEAHEELRVVAEALGASANHFIVLDTTMLAPCAKELKKHAAAYKEIVASGTEAGKFNTFALADALARKDKKSLWILLIRARMAGVKVEDIAGALFWQVKAMRLAQLTKTASEAGMKDFPYKKAKTGAKLFTADELTQLSQALVRIYHEGHAGVDMDSALERFALSV